MQLSEVQRQRPALVSFAIRPRFDSEWRLTPAKGLGYRVLRSHLTAFFCSLKYSGCHKACSVWPTAVKTTRPLPKSYAQPAIALVPRSLPSLISVRPSIFSLRKMMYLGSLSYLTKCCSSFTMKSCTPRVIGCSLFTTDTLKGRRAG